MQSKANSALLKATTQCEYRFPLQITASQSEIVVWWIHCDLFYALCGMACSIRLSSCESVMNYQSLTRNFVLILFQLCFIILITRCRSLNNARQHSYQHIYVYVSVHVQIYIKINIPFPNPRWPHLRTFVRKCGANTSLTPETYERAFVNTRLTLSFYERTFVYASIPGTQKPPQIKLHIQYYERTFVITNYNNISNPWW